MIDPAVAEEIADIARWGAAEMELATTVAEWSIPACRRIIFRLREGDPQVFGLIDG
ncbi:hypothetical protein [Bradyrhizobium ottawaense]|uniref:hypothetical protein n=1 Tax=Bradyrhizobium ottawaense TaxID=931866 RepID=UPI0015CF1B64|nr:hypothetical protein [Bradyrhizobium ottawaense]